MGKNSIRLSEKYGVNPTIPVCFFCGKEKNEVALLGKIGGRGEDIEAPMHCVLDYVPCDDCQSMMGAGITLIEATTEKPSDNRPPMQEDKNTGEKIYPTGKWSVIKEEAASRIFREDVFENIKQSKTILLEEEAYSQIIPDNK